MSGFTADWLALREAADARARDISLLREVRAGTDVLRVVDIGAGTGSNLRYLAPRLRQAQHWTLLDHDASLLSRIERPETDFSLSIETCQTDLSADILRLQGCDLVTASAFFDLVSEQWLGGFAAACASAAVRMGLFVLNVDGRIAWTPKEPEDERIRTLFNEHMRRDKGFGPALGPGVTSALADSFAAAGYAVQIADSTWRLAPEQERLQSALLGFYVDAMRESGEEGMPDVEKWEMRRRAHLAAGTSHLLVGHSDVLVTRRV